MKLHYHKLIKLYDKVIFAIISTFLPHMYSLHPQSVVWNYPLMFILLLSQVLEDRINPPQYTDPWDLINFFFIKLSLYF